jgi:hypothetical protein
MASHVYFITKGFSITPPPYIETEKEMLPFAINL